MSYYTFDQNVSAAYRMSESRRNTKILLVALISIVIAVLLALAIYYIVKRRNANLAATTV